MRLLRMHFPHATRSPGAERIVTTWEDDYDRETWRRFLAGFGYRQVDKAAFEKPIGS